VVNHYFSITVKWDPKKSFINTTKMKQTPNESEQSSFADPFLDPEGILMFLGRLDPDESGKRKLTVIPLKFSA
jgi:hypothetical protein